ncbi:MAG: YfhO family protein [Chthonomonadales bacterium]
MGSSSRRDLFCVVLLAAATCALWGPAIITGRVLLPADIVPLMPPWAATARERFPEYRFAQNQLHGPIFEYYSWRYYARQRLRLGEIPLWNPYELTGNVLLANSQSAVLYPPNILLDVLPLWVGVNLVTALHTFLTGLFLFAFLRGLGLSRPASLTGALVWMFCGLQIVWTEFQTPTAALCWMPAMLLAWQRYLRTRDPKWAVLGGGGAIALSLLAGHLQFTFYAVLAFVLYGIGTSLLDAQHNRTGGPVRRAALGVWWTGAAVLFGMALSMATMLPVMEMSRMNFRGSDTSYRASIALRLPPENLFMLVQPNLFGNPRDYAELDAEGRPADGHPYWGSFDFIEYTAYLGIPGLMLALIGAVVQGTRSPADRALMVLLALLGLALALGTPICALFYYGVPGYRQFHATARALCLFSFGGAALAAFGVEAIQTRLGAWNRRMVAAALGSVVVAGMVAFPGMGLVWRRLFTDQWFYYEIAGAERFAAFALLAIGLIAAALSLKNDRARRAVLWLLPVLCAADLLAWGWRFNPATDPGMLGYPTQTTDFLKQAGADRVVSLETPGRGIKSFIVPNYNAVCGYREIQGADSLHTSLIHRVLEHVVRAMDPSRNPPFPDPNTLHVPSVTNPLFDLLNMKYVVTQSNLDPARFPKVLDAEMAIYRNPRALGPAWVVNREEPETNLDAALDRITSADFDPRHTALVSGRAGPLDPNAAQAQVRLVRFAPHRLEMDVSLPGRGLLVVSEPFFPGWRATVDGHAAGILRVDVLLRGVEVGPGRHRVVLVYDPISYRLGLYISLCALGAALCWMTFRGR